jgi:hypothetical protein
MLILCVEVSFSIVGILAWKIEWGQLLRWMEHTDIINSNGFWQVHFKRW